MNIFATDIDPTISAINLDDIRLNKMILESAALLANAISFHGGADSDLPLTKDKGTPFKTKAWQNHPACVWVKQSDANYNWLFNHLVSLIDEMQYRRGTIHSMSKNIQIISDGVKFLPHAPLTPFVNCTPYKQIPDVIKAYKMTMIYKWEHDAKEPKWTARSAPSWYNSSSIDEVKSANGEFEWTGLRLARSKRSSGWLTNEI